jgi:hypothetical protein
MANRSDYNSKLPRRLKRMLTLTSSGDPHQDGIVRRLFIKAHEAAIQSRKKRLTAKTNVSAEAESEESRQARSFEVDLAT